MDPIIESLFYLLTPNALIWVFIGVGIGVVAGAIPGLGGGMIMAILLPVTFTIHHLDAQIFLIGIYVGGVSGGLISAVLLGVPGSPAAVMTVMDGHAMTKQGKAARALSMGIMASVVGGMTSWVLLVMLSAPLATFAARLQSFDYFAFIVLGLILIAFAGSGSPLRGIVAGLFGMLAAMVGFDSISATNRFTFGVPDIANGFHILPVLIGAFAIRQVFTDVRGGGEQLRTPPTASVSEVVGQLSGVFKYPFLLIRSSVLGSFIGLLPGIGANIGAVISYISAQALSRNNGKFGKGAEEGIIAAECGNNATVGGALMPMISLGIPGSGQDVILMAALVLHQVQPGPMLIYEHPDIFYGIISGYLFANIMMLILMVIAIRYLVMIIRTPMSVLAPAILIFCVVGVISANNLLSDTWVMLGFGVVGYLMSRFKYPLAPFVIGFVLAPLAEERLRSSLMSTGGEWGPLLTRPIAMTCFALVVVVLLFPILKKFVQFRLASE